MRFSIFWLLWLLAYSHESLGQQQGVDYSYAYYTTLAPPAVGPAFEAPAFQAPTFQAPAPALANDTGMVDLSLAAEPTAIPETTTSTTTAISTTPAKYPFIPKLITYWGQNAAEKVIGTPESSLETLCTKRSPYSTIIIGYVNKFSDEDNIDALPGMSFTIHCRKSDSTKYQSLLYCPEIASDIRYCHDKGIKILIGIGGPNSNSYFESDFKAEKLAKDIWNLFLGGDEMPDLRPFGSVVLDGINMFMEPHTHDLHHDHTFLMTLHNLRRTDLARNYLLTLSPSCLFPDPYFGPGPDKVLQKSISLIDQIYVRYTALECCEKGSIGFKQSLEDWKRLVSNPALRGISTAELFIGVPAKPETTSASCYRSAEELLPVFHNARENSRFRGFLIIDNSFDLVNNTEGFVFSRQLYTNIIPQKYHSYPEFAKILNPDSLTTVGSTSSQNNNGESNADMDTETTDSEKNDNEDEVLSKNKNNETEQQRMENKPKTKLKFKSRNNQNPHEFKYNWRKLRKIHEQEKHRKHPRRRKYKYKSESNDDNLDLDRYDILDYEDDLKSREKNKHKKPNNKKKWKQKADHHFVKFIESYYKAKSLKKTNENHLKRAKHREHHTISRSKTDNSLADSKERYHRNDKKQKPRKNEKMYSNEREYHYLRSSKKHNRKYHPKKYRHRQKENKSIYEDKGRYALFPENKSKQHKDTELVDPIGVVPDMEDMQIEEEHEGELSHEQEHHEVHFAATPKPSTPMTTAGKTTESKNATVTTPSSNNSCCFPTNCECCMPEFNQFFCSQTTPAPATTLKQPPTQPYDEDIETDQPDPITAQPATVKEGRTGNLMTRNNKTFDNHRDDRYYHRDGMQAFNDIEVIAHASAPNDPMQTYQYEKLLQRLRSHPGLFDDNSEQNDNTQQNEQRDMSNAASNSYLSSNGGSNENYGANDDPITDQHPGSLMLNSKKNTSGHLHNNNGNQTYMKEDYKNLFKNLKEKITKMDKKYTSAIDNQVSIGLYPDVTVGCPCMVQLPCSCQYNQSNSGNNTTMTTNKTTNESKLLLVKPDEVKTSPDSFHGNRSIYFTEVNSSKPGQSHGANSEVRPEYQGSQTPSPSSIEYQQPVNTPFATAQTHSGKSNSFEDQPIMVETQVIPTNNMTSETLDCVITLDYDPATGSFKQTCNKHETPSGTKIISNVSPLNLSNPQEAKLHEEMLRKDPKGNEIQSIPMTHNSPPPENTGVINDRSDASSLTPSSENTAVQNSYLASNQQPLMPSLTPDTGHYTQNNHIETKGPYKKRAMPKYRTLKTKDFSHSLKT